MHPIAVAAHRGSPDAAAGIRENTLAAFARARRLGADGVELDVRRTADGGLAIHHDPVIEGSGAIHELRTDQLPPDVPLLEAALDECRGMTVNVEVKNLPGEPGFDPDERCVKGVGEQIASSAPPGRQSWSPPSGRAPSRCCTRHARRSRPASSSPGPSVQRGW